MTGDRTFRGEVTNVDDPEKLGRVKFKSDDMLEGKEHPRWAYPAFPSAGFFSLPVVGERIEVFLERGDIKRPHWRATVFTQKVKPPEEALSVYPFGHYFGRDTGYLLVDDKNKTIGIYHRDGEFVVKLTKDTVTIGEEDGMQITLTSDQIKIGKTNGKQVLVDDTNVLLGAVSGHLALMNENLVMWLSTHTHGGVSGGGQETLVPTQPLITAGPTGVQTTDTKAT